MFSRPQKYCWKQYGTLSPLGQRRTGGYSGGYSNRPGAEETNEGLEGQHWKQMRKKAGKQVVLALKEHQGPASLQHAGSRGAASAGH